MNVSVHPALALQASVVRVQMSGHTLPRVRMQAPGHAALPDVLGQVVTTEPEFAPLYSSGDRL